MGLPSIVGHRFGVYFSTNSNWRVSDLYTCTLHFRCAGHVVADPKEDFLTTGKKLVWKSVVGSDLRSSFACVQSLDSMLEYSARPM